MKIFQDRKKLTKIMWFAGILYITCAIVVIVFRFVEALIEGEPLLDNVMYNFRTFAFALFSVSHQYNFLIMDPIGFFAIPLIIFFGIFFYLTFNFVHNKKNTITNIIIFVIALIATFEPICIPFCILPSLCLSTLLYFFNT